MPDDKVTLIIRGRDFTGWTASTIKMNIDDCADAFSLTAPFDPSDPTIKLCFKPREYQDTQVLIGDDVVLTGRQEKVNPHIGPDGRTLNVQGRSLTGQLVDCSIDGDLEFSGLTLAAIARKICKPFGISVRADTDTTAIDIASAKYGQSPYDFLASIAGPRNILLNSSFKGELVLTDGRALMNREPIATLIEGKPPLVSVDPNFDSTVCFSYYKVSSQQDGSPDSGGRVDDTTIKRYRPRLVEMDSVEQDPRRAASWERSKAFADSMSVSAQITGWRRTDGKLWAERQALMLQAPGAMLTRESKWLIGGPTHTMDADSGQMTTMRLIVPETYSGTIPKVLPWD
jgi:prophage tail gpP-like protein